MASDFINVRRIIGERNPTLLRWLPGFVIRYLEYILHQEDINAFLYENAEVDAYTFCTLIIEKFDITLDVKGLDNLPEQGGVMVLNHPLGGMDAMAIVSLLKDRRPDIKFIVNDVLLNMEVIKELFVGVNLLGKNSKTSLQKVDELFASNQLICLFPAGLVSRRINGRIEDLEWKKTFVTRARKYGKQVIPAHLNGELTNFFYRLANVRAMLRIPVNIEMLYLVHELYKQRGKHMTLTIGQAIASANFDKSKSDQEWAQWMKAKVYRLGQQ